MNDKKKLGKGLDALLSTGSTQAMANLLGKQTEHQQSAPASEDKDGDLKNIPIDLIQRGKYQPRTDMHEEALQELAASIKSQGVMQPIVIRPLSSDKYEIIAGERRWRASQIAGLDKIPAIIKPVGDEAAIAMSLIENIQRENLNPIEIALSYQRLIEEINLTQEQCSERVGKKRSTITNFLRLLKLPEIIQKALIEGTISNGHARSLLSLNSKSSQINLCHDIIENGYSVREVEQLSKEFSTKKYKKTSSRKRNLIELPFSKQKIMHDLSRNFNTSIEIKRNQKGRGKLIIPFNDDNDFDRIIKLLEK